MRWLAAGALVLLSLCCVHLCATGAFLQYGNTRLIGSLPNVTLTVGWRETVLCLQATEPLPTAREWYNPQGQLVSRDGGDEVNQADAGGRVTFLKFHSYQQSQGGKYECRVYGPGNTSEKLPLLIEPYIIPPRPTDTGVSVLPLNEAGKIRVTWSRPTLGPEQVITGYSVQYRRRNTTSYTTHSVSGSNTTSYTITNLNLGTVYEVRVASVGPLGLSGYCCGSGKWVTTYNSNPCPSDAGVSVVALDEAGKVRVTWSRPTLGPGQVITGYSVQYRRRGTTSYTTSSVSGSSATLYTITNLNLGTAYEVRVAYVGPLGLSGYCCGSGKQVTTYNILPPDEVSSYPLPQPGTVRVTWTQAPSSTRGVTLTGYSVQYREEGGDRYQSQQVTDTPSLGELETFELEGLELGTTYEIRVAMVTTLGVGMYSDVINATTYADCCSECSSIQSTVFVSFEVAEMKVDESDTLVHIDVFRYGPMSAPIILRVTDIPLTAKRIQDYSLQSSSLVFLNTERMVERSTVVVRIREDSTPEQDPPTESFRLVLSSSAGGGMQPAVVFSVPEMKVQIRDNDY